MLAHGRPLAPILRGAGADFQRLFADAEQGRGDVLENASSTHAGARSLCPTGRNPCTAAVGLPRTLSPGLSRWQWRAASKRVPCWRTVTRAIATVDRCHSSGRSSCTGRTVLYQKAIKNISVNMSTSYGPPKTITCRFWATR